MKKIIVQCFVLLLAASLTSCGKEEQQSSPGPENTQVTTTPASEPEVNIPTVATALPQARQEASGNTQFEIGNTRYLFNISDHSPEDLQALLSRAEEIRETHADGYDELEIVLVLHGPDINIFRQQNYSKHKPLVDLAARLDAFDIIDMRICETTMSSMGVERSEVPAFIESVPYAPDEIRRLADEGYINL